MMHPTPDQIADMQAHAHEDRRPWFIGVNIACLVLAFLSVMLRFLSRLKIGTKIGLDDWLICVAAIFLLGHVVCLMVVVRHGFGRHAIFVDSPKAISLISLVAQTFYNLSVPTIKASILCLYGRIFHRTIGWFTPVLWGTGLFVVFYTIPCVFAYLFQCVPIDSLWTEYGPGTKVVCINFKAVIMAFGIINIVTDWWILALPIPVVLSLQLDRRTKWSICSLFLIGGFVCILSIVRLIYARQVETVDPSWDYVPISAISSSECSIGILAACMPTWRPLFKFLGRGITSYFSNKGRSNDDSNLQYGNNVVINRVRWSKRRRSKSLSRSRKGLKIDHNGMGSGRISFIPGGKRSETSMSGDSIEKMLKGIDVGGIELVESKTTSGSPARSIGRSDSTIKKSSTGNSSGPQNLDFASGSYEATAGADRWEGLMKQQRLKNDNDDRGRGRTMSPGPKKGFGNVAYGGRGVSVSIESTREPAPVARRSEDRDVERGLGGDGVNGMGGIVVTRTVTSVSGDGR